MHSCRRPDSCLLITCHTVLYMRDESQRRPHTPAAKGGISSFLSRDARPPSDVLMVQRSQYPRIPLPPIPVCQEQKDTHTLPQHPLPAPLYHCSREIPAPFFILPSCALLSCPFSRLQTRSRLSLSLYEMSRVVTLQRKARRISDIVSECT